MPEIKDPVNEIIKKEEKYNKCITCFAICYVGVVIFLGINALFKLNLMP
jgi:hypothetical protein